MADIFISYAHEDTARVALLAEALERAGYDVWWDRHVAGGTAFADVTAQELAGAKVILVAWSEAAIGSHWVKDEAAEGRDSGRLVPISLDGVQPPLGFRQVQTIEFRTWAGGDPKPLEELAFALALKLDEAVRPIPAPRPAAARLRRRFLAVAAGVAAIALVVVAWATWNNHFSERARASITRSVTKVQPVVAVAAFQNQTGDAKLDWLSEGIASLVRDGLAESSHLIVVSQTRWRAVLRDHEGGGGAATDVLSSAARAGIDYVMTGEFQVGPEGLLLTARMSDVDGGVDFAPHRNDRLSAQTLLGEASRLVLMAKRGLGVPHTESVAGFSADFAVKNMAAYETYLNGIGFFLKFDYRSAERAFRKALELAPDFHMARYRLAHVEVASGDTTAGLATLDRIPIDAALTRRERFYVDGAHAYFERDVERAQAIYSSMLQEFPFDVEARWLLALSYDLAFEDDAAVAELKRLLEQEPQNDHFWSYLGESYLRLGEYDLARQALDQYLKFKPRDPFGFTTLGQLDLLTGNLSGAADHLTHALELEPGFVPARLALARTQVLRNMWDDAEAQLRRLASDEEAPAGIRIDAAFDLSGLLRGQGRFADSLRPLEMLEPLIRKEGVREAMALAERGTAHAELGQFDQADRLIALAVERSPGVPTRYLFARASVLLLRRDADGAHAAATEILNQPMPQDSPQDIAVVQEAAIRAATYLEGLADVLAGNPAKGRETLARAVAMPGHRYAIYKLGLARALLLGGKFPEALEMARAAAIERDPGDIRLDLELDRSRALLLEAEILAAQGEKAASAARSREFLRRWKAADPGQVDLARAASLAVP